MSSGIPSSDRRRYVRRRLFQNSALIFVAQVVATSFSLVSVPVIIAKLGMEGYGVWESILAASMLCAIFQTPIRGTLLWKTSAAYGADRPSDVIRLVRLGVTATLSIFLVVAPLIFFARHLVVDLISVPLQYSGIAAWIVVGVVAVMTLSGINETIGAAISGCQQAGLTALLDAARMISRNLVVIVALVLGWGFWSLLIGLAAGYFAAAVALYATACKTCGPVSLMPVIPTRAECRSMGPYAALTFVGSVSGALRDQTDKVVLAMFASSIWVAYYGIAARLASLVQLVCRFFNVPMSAATGALYAARDWAGVRRLYSNIVVIVSVLSGAVVVLAAGLYDRLLVAWLGEVVPEVGPLLFLLLSGVAVAVVLTDVGAALCKGIGRVEIETKFLVVSLIINLILKVTLVFSIGAIGTVIASSASWAIASVVFVVIMHRALELPRDATRRASLVLAVVLVLVLIARIAFSYVPIPTGRIPALLSACVLGGGLMVGYSAGILGLGIITVQNLRDAWVRVRAHVAEYAR